MEGRRIGVTMRPIAMVLLRRPMAACIFFGGLLWGGGREAV
jgi:hypothetical protein